MSQNDIVSTPKGVLWPIIHVCAHTLLHLCIHVNTRTQKNIGSCLVCKLLSQYISGDDSLVSKDCQYFFIIIIFLTCGKQPLFCVTVCDLS